MKTRLIVATVLVLAGCAAAPTRDDASAFAVKDEGTVAVPSLPKFTDCLLDGFSRSHSMLANISVRQQVRSNVTRVETAAGGSSVLMSADIFPNGKTLLYESETAALIDTSGERKAYAKCLAKYKVAGK